MQLYNCVFGTLTNLRLPIKATRIQPNLFPAFFLVLDLPY